MDELNLVIKSWHWLVLALLLIGAETVGAGGFLIGLAVAAALMSALVYFLTVSWQWQLVDYALISMICTWIYWRFLRPFNDKPDELQINDRAAHLLGRRLVLQEAVQQGEGRVQIGDTLWKIVAAKDYPAGTEIEIVAKRGMMLEVTATHPDTAPPLS